MRTVERLPSWMVVGLLSSCTTGPEIHDLFFAGRVEQAAGLAHQEMAGGSLVDHCMRLLEAGTTDLALGRIHRAAASFASANDIIDDLRGVDTDEAEELGSPELVKEFKGEPYEQSLCAYYEGLALLAQGRAELARTRFQRAQDFDCIGNGEFPLPVFMEAVMHEQLGSQEEARQQLQLFEECSTWGDAKGLVAILRRGSWGALLVLDCGEGPRKLQSGPGGSHLGYEPGSGRIANLDVRVGRQSQSVVQVASVFDQATERGPRGMDSTNEEKQAWKERRREEAMGLAQGSGRALREAVRQEDPELQRRSRDLSRKGAYLSMALTVVSERARPGADTRAWRTLPGAIYVVLLPEQWRSEGFRVHARDRQGEGVAASALSWVKRGVVGGRDLVYVRLLDGVPGPEEIALGDLASRSNAILEDHRRREQR